MQWYVHFAACGVLNHLLCIFGGSVFALCDVQYVMCGVYGVVCVLYEECGMQCDDIWFGLY